MGVYLFAFLFFFMALGVPIAFAMAMGLAATIHVWGGISFSMLFQQIFQGINSFTFIAVPMFILCLLYTSHRQRHGVQVETVWAAVRHDHGRGACGQKCQDLS